jgi:hypothetical protein
MKKEGNHKWLRKAAVIGLILVGMAVFNYLDLGQYLSLDYIKASQDKFQMLYQAHQVLVIGAYTGLYIVVAALSLPGAAVITLAGGALFGLTIIVYVNAGKELAKIDSLSGILSPGVDLRETGSAKRDRDRHFHAGVERR